MKIRELERWIAQKGQELQIKPKYQTLNGKKVAVVGSGVAGLTCVHYLARIGYQVDLYHETTQIGGFLNDLAKEGKIDRLFFEKELRSMLPSSVSIHDNWKLENLHQLEDLTKQYAGAFITVKCAVDYSNEKVAIKYPTMVVGGMAYHMENTPYDLVHAIRDGRRAAEKLNQLIKH